MLIIGRNPILEALKNNREMDTLYVKQGNQEGSIVKILAKARDKNILIKEVNRKKLDELSGGEVHQGVVALVSEYQYYDLEEVLATIEKKREDPFFIVLDEVEDPHNLGAIIRTAEGAGAHGVIIGKRRSAQVNHTVEKTSAGAVSYLPIIRVSNISQTLDKLKKENIWIYALDMTGQSYFKTNLTGRIALVVGNEGKGISRIIKEKSDHLLSIPMKGKMQSLNASVATSVLTYEVLRQRSLDS